MTPTKDQAWRYAKAQLEASSSSSKDRHKKADKYDRVEQWHYGKCEIAELLDFIYDGIYHEHQN